MIITSSNVNMASARSYRKRELSFSEYSSNLVDTGAKITQSDFEKLMSAKENDLAEHKESLAAKSNGVRNTLFSNQMGKIEKVRQEIFQYFLRLLFGDPCSSESVNPYEYAEDRANNEQTYEFGFSTQSYLTHYEFQEDESVQLNTSGIVQTADGRTIEFGMQMNLSRSFTMAASQQIDFTQPVLIDPLVIQVDSDFIQMDDQTFFFDMDADGTAEEIKGLGQGSGFLALDRNNNGTIDDGSELFGTKSGNGFADLAAYDEDGNGWIDEADSIFSKLKVWCKNPDGTDHMMDLKSASVGAIYLGSSTADFSLTDSMNHTDAIIRRHGIFLYENGNVGTIAQVDMAVAADYQA